ncbi:MAG: hypothetical protein ACMG57_01800 [Candidatus Dojkabacteria bacterium]
MADDSTGVKNLVLDEEKRMEMAKQILEKNGNDFTKLPPQLIVAWDNAMEIDPNLMSSSEEDKLSAAIAVALDTQMMSLDEINALIS